MTFLDLLIEQTKTKPDYFGTKASKEDHSGGGSRIADSVKSEQDRQLSIKSTPVTLCLPDVRGKSYYALFWIVRDP